MSFGRYIGGFCLGVIAFACTPAGPFFVCDEARPCPAGFACEAGACVDRRCRTTGCPEGQACVNDACVSTDCGGGVCAAGEACEGGRCVDALCVGLACEGGLVCVRGRCVAPRCPDRACPPNAFCEAGECVDRACAGVVCAADQGCAAGRCLPRSCGEAETCGSEELCADGACVARSCVGVACAAGERCGFGRCLPANCGAVACASAEVCDAGRCVDASCAGSPCGAGHYCAGGSCLACAAAEVSCGDVADEDCDGLTDCADEDCSGRTCGAHGRVCGSGACACAGGGAPEAEEATCDDGLDNDCDGAGDCEDPSCDTQRCGAHGQRCAAGACGCPTGNTETACALELDEDCDGLRGCADPDCLDQPCSDGDACSVAERCRPGATCLDPLPHPGFDGAGAACEDIDECSLTPGGGCGSGTTCVNVVGSRRCDCLPGHAAGPDLPADACADVDECLNDNGGCAPDAACTNTVGGRTCACLPGFSGDGFTCADVDECLDPDACGPHSTCLNEAGGVRCGCLEGYAPAAEGAGCEDVDECLVAHGGCSPDATCANTSGGRTCTCKPGYAGDGVTCVDVDECLVAHGGCAPEATCTNTPGGRRCACDPGYAGDGLTCTDIDECLSGNGGCGPRATCANTAGGRRCTCLPGYVGDGVRCLLGYFFDEFDRAATTELSTPGLPWREEAGDWSIAGGEAVCSPSAGAVALASFDAQTNGALLEVGAGAAAASGWGLAWDVVAADTFRMLVVDREVVAAPLGCPSGGTLAGTKCSYDPTYVDVTVRTCDGWSDCGDGSCANGPCNFYHPCNGCQRAPGGAGSCSVPQGGGCYHVNNGNNCQCEYDAPKRSARYYTVQQPRCPSGGSFDASTSKCVYAAVAVAAATCPRGGAPAGSTCAYPALATPFSACQCPTGTQWVPGFGCAIRRAGATCARQGCGASLSCDDLGDAPAKACDACFSCWNFVESAACVAGEGAPTCNDGASLSGAQCAYAAVGSAAAVQTYRFRVAEVSGGVVTDVSTSPIFSTDDASWRVASIRLEAAGDRLYPSATVWNGSVADLPVVIGAPFVPAPAGHVFGMVLAPSPGQPAASAVGRIFYEPR